MKNTVDKVVTEHGVAELRGKGIRERTAALIAVADPRFRNDLAREAAVLGYA
jgi:acyl-CoA hydrolase